MTIEAKLDRIIELLEAKAVNPTCAAEAKKPRAAKPAATSAATDAAAPATPAAPAPATEAPAATATSPSKEPTLDDVRAALVALQTRKGTKAPAQAILEKYSPTKVTGGLKKEDYAKVIAECAAA